VQAGTLGAVNNGKLNRRDGVEIMVNGDRRAKSEWRAAMAQPAARSGTREEKRETKRNEMWQHIINRVLNHESSSRGGGTSNKAMGKSFSPADDKHVQAIDGRTNNRRE